MSGLTCKCFLLCSRTFNNKPEWLNLPYWHDGLIFLSINVRWILYNTISIVNMRIDMSFLVCFFTDKATESAFGENGILTMTFQSFLAYSQSKTFAGWPGKSQNTQAVQEKLTSCEGNICSLPAYWDFKRTTLYGTIIII